ncbi:hypothetical protein CspHIS471_0311190 [Cutaneotrichosporon sp. HIS471]|nr:hypothetical protein CspHIS471_0311190 [Cutaneotrichosporon sp. HIS471]
MPAVIPTTSAAKRTVAECDAIMTAPGSPLEMIDTIIDGQKHKAWKHNPQTYRDYLTPLFMEWKDREFLSSPLPEPAEYDDREHVTYGQVYGRAVQSAAWLRSKGVGYGDRVAVGGGNNTGWVVSWLAILLIGASPVLLNATLTDDAQVHCLGVCTPKLVLVDSKMAQQLAGLTVQLRAKNVGPVWCWSSVAHLDNVRDNVSEIRAVSAQLVNDVLQGRGGVEQLNGDSDGIIFFTSGTTGYPKAVLSTQRAQLHVVLSGMVPHVRALLRAGGNLADLVMPTEQSTTLLSIPLFHASGCLSTLVATIRVGGKLVFQRCWSVPDAIKLILAEKVGTIGGVPAIATAILQSPLLPKTHQFASVGYGGAPPAKRLANDLNSRFPNAVVGQGWGMTETNAPHCNVNGQDYLERPTSIGPVLPICQIKIIHPETRKELPQGEAGIILARGPNIMKGYLNNPQATAEVLQNGWMDTGDVGLIDPDGFVHLSDRHKDIIIRGGENIASLEVENAVAQDDRVAEVAAVSVPDDVLGELVGVAVSLAPGVEATEASIIHNVIPHLRYPARPVIALVLPDPLPRNANGKIVKADVRKLVRAAYAEKAPRAKL